MADAVTRRRDTLQADEAVPWVLAGNERAAAFYQRLGWAFDGAEETTTVWGVEAHDLRMRRRL